MGCQARQNHCSVVSSPQDVGSGVVDPAWEGALGCSGHPEAGAVVVTAGPQACSLEWWKAPSLVSLGFAPKPDHRYGEVLR